MRIQVYIDYTYFILKYLIKKTNKTNFNNKEWKIQYFTTLKMIEI